MGLDIKPIKSIFGKNRSSGEVLKKEGFGSVYENPVPDFYQINTSDLQINTGAWRTISDTGEIPAGIYYVHGSADISFEYNNTTGSIQIVITKDDTNVTETLRNCQRYGHFEDFGIEIFNTCGILTLTSPASIKFKAIPSISNQFVFKATLCVLKLGETE